MIPLVSSVRPSTYTVFFSSVCLSGCSIIFYYIIFYSILDLLITPTPRITTPVERIEGQKETKKQNTPPFTSAQQGKGNKKNAYQPQPVDPHRATIPLRRHRTLPAHRLGHDLGRVVDDARAAAVRLRVRADGVSGPGCSRVAVCELLCANRKGRLWHGEDAVQGRFGGPEFGVRVCL